MFIILKHLLTIPLKRIKTHYFESLKHVKFNVYFKKFVFFLNTENFNSVILWKFLS